MGIKTKTREQQKRKPAGMPRQRLKVDGLAESKRGYWANESQIQELKDAGYTFVSNSSELTIGEDGHVNKSSVISKPASRSTDEKLYLMQISKAYYEENNAIKQERISDQENEMFNRGNTETSYSVKGNRNTTEMLGARHGK